MQNDKYTDFDLELKQMLGGAQEEVPSRLWDAVCSELDRRDRRKVVALRWRRAAACVAAAAAVVAGLFIFTGRESAPEPVRTAEVIEDTDVVVEDIPSIEEQISASAGAALASVPEQAVRRPAASASVPSAVQPADTFVPEEIPEAEPVPEQVTEVPADPVETPAKPAEVRNEPSITFDPDDPFAWDLEDEPESASILKRISFSASGNAMTNDFTGTSVLQMRAPASGVKARTGVEEKGTSTYSIPLTFGAGVRFNFSDRWSVGTGVNWSMLSSTFNGTYTEVNSDIIRSINSEIVHDIHYIGIPLNAYYNILNNRNLRFYAWGGGTAERAVSNRFRIKSDAGDIFYKESVDGLQFSVASGLGLEFLIGRHFGLYLDPSARYYFDCGQPSSIRTKHPFMLNFEVGARFNL
ncbi:MAG: outer membrane beta-barrel protein [Bacteroidales bacterium]|nr:outer membrane beta-barrel protein [Bacteroidales bacterium]